MKFKKILTAALLVFVAASIVYLAANFNTSAADNEYTTPIKDLNSLDVMVYYIHNNTRCINCIRFEQYTKDVINDVFAEQVKNGRLAFKMANYETSANSHYIKDYKLVTKAVIVSKMKNGKQTEWKNLDKIWELVNNEVAFKAYITDEVAVYLGAN